VIDNSKVIRNDAQWLVMPIVIASEIVQQYDNGFAYKPGEELEKMALNAELVGAKPIKILEHPQADTNYLIQRQSDISGKATNFRYVKNLLDAKTKRPCRKGVLADGWWSKADTPPEVITDILSGKMRDCSIGFSYDTDETPGEFDGSKYDYVQRNIYLDHIAAPIPAGRCPGPICGIGYDSLSKQGFNMENDSECPVCTRIKTVGFNVAGKRLYQHYGADILEVIEGNPLPQPEPANIVKIVTDLDAAFNDAFQQLKLRLQNSQK
jgi:hypothetical protein